MNFTIIKKLPSIEDTIREIPLSDHARNKIAQDRDEIKKIISGEDPRLLMVVGPCSAWPQEAVITYAKCLQQINHDVSDVLKIVMRCYIQKPRTIKGWPGPAHQPDPLGQPDIEKGLRYVRQMMIDVINIGLPIADEALFTDNASGFLELISWLAVGARSAEGQQHRIFASGVDLPVGLKNPTHGSLEVGVNGVIVAQESHVTQRDGHEIKTHGNPYAHLVLRGGNGRPNYSNEHLECVHRYMLEHKIAHPAVIIDASHDNCIFNGKKDHKRQPDVILEVLDNIESNPTLKNVVKGFMVESFIHEGRQQVNPQDPSSIDLSGLSITDPCLDWRSTESMLINLAQRLRS